MLATERLLEIGETCGEKVQSIVPLELDGETLRLILYLKDGANLRVTEQWQGKTLLRYSYYWLTSANELKIGWDNAPLYSVGTKRIFDLIASLDELPELFNVSTVRFT